MKAVIIDSVLISFIAIVALIIVIVTDIRELVAMDEDKDDGVIYLTAEEMARRPMMTIVIENDEDEAIAEEVVPAYRVYEGVPMPADHQILAQELCSEYHVGYAFFLAMLESESTFNPDAVGDGSKSVGYMQINKPNWYRYGLDAFEIYDNLEIGIRMLSELIEKYQECDAVIMAYKGGEAQADEWIAEGFRLEACDIVTDRAVYWQTVLDKEGGKE